MTEPSVFSNDPMEVLDAKSDAWKEGYAKCKSDLTQALRELVGPHCEEHLVEKVDLCTHMGIDPGELEDG